MVIWDLTEDWGFRLGSWARQMMVEAIDDSLPELKHDLPGRTPWRVRAHHDGVILALVWEAGEPSSINSFGTLEAGEFDLIKAAAGPKRTYVALRSDPALSRFFGPTSFLWIGTMNGAGVVAEELQEQLIDWLNDEPLTIAERLNAERVRRALPEPPQYPVEAIAKACWVVESPAAFAQGTAFRLEGYGFVTCEHVLYDHAGIIYPDLELFHSANPSARFLLRDVVANRALDLAIFQADVPNKATLQVSSVEDMPLQAHVAVCGFPNYRLGDTCTLSPGVVVAHRMARGGVRRLLTNAGIVAGMSGGPAIAAGREVIGVCVTGATWMQNTRETEDQAIIPISALELLAAQS